MSTIRRIHPVHIILHALSIYFLGIGCSILSALLDIEGLQVMHQFRTKGVIGGDFTERMTRLVNITGFGMLFGVVAGFGASLFVTIKRRGFWLNSLLAFLLFGGSLFFIISQKLDMGPFLWFIARAINLSAIPSYAVTGLFWTSAALFLLFSPASRNVLSSQPKEEKDPVFQFEDEPAIK